MGNNCRCDQFIVHVLAINGIRRHIIASAACPRIVLTEGEAETADRHGLCQILIGRGTVCNRHNRGILLAQGTVELLQGGSHASGHDISLGRKADGTERRAEGGEFFAVINKRNSRRYRNIIPDVIDSFNDGTFADKYQRANNSMAGYAVEMIGGGADLSRLEKGVDAIQRQGEQRRTVEGDFLVVRYKNLTQKIKN